MNLLEHALATTLLVTLSSAASATPSSGEPDRDSLDDGATAYQLRVVSTATSLNCDAAHSFTQTLSSCSVLGCNSRDITDRVQLAFTVERGGRVAVATSTAYQRNGVIFGDSAVDELKAGASGRFVQTVAGKDGCMKSVVYDVLRVGE